MSKLNKPEVLKVAGFAVMVAAAFFAPTSIQVPLFAGAVLVVVGYSWSRLTS